MTVMCGMKDISQIESFMELSERSNGLNITFWWSAASEANLGGTLLNIRSIGKRLLETSEHKQTNNRSLGVKLIF